MPDLESGFARELFIEYAQNPNNLILFTEKALTGTLARHLQDASPTSVTLEVKKRVPLEGIELDEFHKKRQQSQEEEKKSKVDRTTLDEDEDEDEDEDDLTATKNAFQHASDVTSLKFTEEGFKHPMFPFAEKHSIFDEYGETVNMHELFVEDNPSSEPKQREVSYCATLILS